MEISIFGILLFMAFAMVFLYGVYEDKALLGFSGLTFILLGAYAIRGKVVKTLVVNSTITQVPAMEQSFNPFALLIILFGTALLISAAFPRGE